MVFRGLIVFAVWVRNGGAISAYSPEGYPLMTPSSTDTARWVRAMMLIIPDMWIGLIIGISFIAAPLKFTAPGITIPLGLGIGRRVFLAMNIRSEERRVGRRVEVGGRGGSAVADDGR